MLVKKINFRVNSNIENNEDGVNIQKRTIKTGEIKLWI